MSSNFILISHRTPLRCEPLWLTFSHLALLDRRRLVQMSALSGWYDSKIAPQLLDTDDVSSLGSTPTQDIALEKETT